MRKILSVFPYALLFIFLFILLRGAEVAAVFRLDQAWMTECDKSFFIANIFVAVLLSAVLWKIRKAEKVSINSFYVLVTAICVFSVLFNLFFVPSIDDVAMKRATDEGGAPECGFTFCR